MREDEMRVPEEQEIRRFFITFAYVDLGLIDRSVLGSEFKE